MTTDLPHMVIDVNFTITQTTIIKNLILPRETTNISMNIPTRHPNMTLMPTTQIICPLQLHPTKPIILVTLPKINITRILNNRHMTTIITLLNTMTTLMMIGSKITDMKPTYPPNTNYSTQAPTPLPTQDLIPMTFIVPCLIEKAPFGSPLTVLLDSGSISTWINQHCLPHHIHGRTVPTITGSTMAGAFKSTKELVLNEMVLPELCRNTYLPKCPARIFNADCRYDMILGHNALRSLHITLDFDHKTSSRLLECRYR